MTEASLPPLEIRPSSIDRLLACGASAILGPRAAAHYSKSESDKDSVDRSSMAEEGMLHHVAFSSAWAHSAKTDELYPMDDEFRAALIRKAVRLTDESLTALGADTTPLKSPIGEYPVTMTLGAGLPDISGTADVHTLGSVPVLADLKSLFGDYELGASGQIRCYGTGLIEDLDCDRVLLVMVSARNGVTIGVWNRQAADRWRERVAAVVQEVLDGDVRASPGMHCRFCPALGTEFCLRGSRWAEKVSEAVLEVSASHVATEKVTRQSLGRAAKLCIMAKTAVKAVEERARDYMEREGLTTMDHVFLKPGNTIESPKVPAGVCAKKLNLPDSFASNQTTTLAKLESALKREHPDKSKKELREMMREADILNSRTNRPSLSILKD